MLFLKDKADDKRDKLLWKWNQGQATTQAEFSDPVVTAGYRLCVYDGGDFLLGAAVPASAARWAALGDKGYRYRDTIGSEAGILRILLKGSDPGEDKAKVTLKGKGANLPDPLLGGVQLPVTAQLRNTQTGVCLEGVYGAGDVVRSDAGQFKAKVR